MPLAPSVHITRFPSVCGGKPCVAGTRIRVWGIHVWHDLQGQSPAEIVADFPQLTVSDIYAALSYYLDHRREIEQQMAAVDKFVAEQELKVGPSLIERLRLRSQADADVSPQ